MRCHTDITDHSTAHYGRIVSGWQSSLERNTKYELRGGVVVTIPMVTEKTFPRKVTGLCCHECYTELWNTAWHDSKGHLRRAFENVIPKVEQPKNDDHEASSITKGLYAPHAKGGSLKNAVIDEASLPYDPAEDRKLQGFNRPKRDDIKIDSTKRKVIVRKGKWRVHPDEYGYGK